jgi:hypothetical protein
MGINMLYLVVDGILVAVRARERAQSRETLDLVHGPRVRAVLSTAIWPSIDLPGGTTVMFRGLNEQHEMHPERTRDGLQETFLELEDGCSVTLERLATGAFVTASEITLG